MIKRAAAPNVTSVNKNVLPRRNGPSEITEKATNGKDLKLLQDLPNIAVRMNNPTNTEVPAMINSGAEANMISEEVALQAGMTWWGDEGQLSHIPTPKRSFLERLELIYKLEIRTLERASLFPAKELRSLASWVCRSFGLRDSRLITHGTAEICSFK
jgi:hypothetical protein